MNGKGLCWEGGAVGGLAAYNWIWRPAGACGTEVVAVVRGERSGREPTEARSARGLRTVYAVIALVIGLAAGIWLWSIRPGSGEEGSTAFAIAALSCLLVAVVSAIDLAILLLRRRGSR